MDHSAMQLRMRSRIQSSARAARVWSCAWACVSPPRVRCLGVLLAATSNLENELKLDFISELLWLLLLLLLVYSNADAQAMPHMCEWPLMGASSATC